MDLSVPANLAGVESPCPGCGELIIAPIPARPAVLAKAVGFTQTLKKPDDLVAVAAEKESDAAPEPAEAAPEETRPSLMHSVFVPVSAKPAAPVLPEPESVEELLKDVKFTVVETNKTRALVLQLTAAVVVLAPAVWFAPSLFKQLETKLAPALGLVPPNREETVKKAEPAATTKSRRLMDSPANNYASVPISSTGTSDWKPHQQSTISASYRQQSPHQARTFAGNPITPSSSGNVWGTPAPQQRITRFTSGPRMTSLSSGSNSGGSAPGPYASGSPASAPTNAGYVTTAMTSGGSGAPIIGYTSGDQTTEIIYGSSLLEIADAVKGTPEWMRQPVEVWPPRRAAKRWHHAH
jgi:hypothetical protein